MVRRIALALLLTLAPSGIAQAGDVWTTPATFAQDQRALCTVLNVGNRPLTNVTFEIFQAGGSSSQIVDIPVGGLASKQATAAQGTNVWCHISGNNAVNALAVLMGLCILDPSPDDRCHTFIQGY